MIVLYSTNGSLTILRKRSLQFFHCFLILRSYLSGILWILHLLHSLDKHVCHTYNKSKLIMTLIIDNAMLKGGKDNNVFYKKCKG